MRHKNLFQWLPILLLLPFLVSSLNPAFGASTDGVIVDPLSGDRYEDAPPAELLEGMSPAQIHGALRNWVRLDDGLKRGTRAYFHCQDTLESLEIELAKAKDEEAIKTAERIKKAKNLKRILVAALGRLGLQTAVIIADGTTDVHLALRKLGETNNKNISDIKNARKNAEMLAEAERLARKAAAGRRLLQQAETQLAHVLRQIEQAKLKKGIKISPKKNFKLKAMDPVQFRKDKAYGVKYFNSMERENYRIKIKDGKMYDAEGNLFDTTDSQANVSTGKNRAIFIMDDEGKFYYYRHPANDVIHHSSLNFGKPVAFAGEIKVIEGKLKYMNNWSGHYKPGVWFMKQAERYLESMGVNMYNVKLDYITEFVAK
ncbi:MAG: hypothetical protein R6U13_16325 [Desulfatiglandaceae bacterium]